jgi:hypothetical protein
LFSNAEKPRNVYNLRLALKQRRVEISWGIEKSMLPDAVHWPIFPGDAPLESPVGYVSGPALPEMALAFLGF